MVERGRVVAILGMHRSGTSWLAGSLQQRGLELGEVFEQSRYNARGNRENRELVRIQEGVLSDNGGAWLFVPDEIRWSPKRKEQLRSFVEAMSSHHPTWGFKDPRTLLFLDEWLELVPQLEFVGVFRHPVAVHRSLHRRNQIVDRKLAVSLWTTYNGPLVALHRRRPFPIIRFDVPPSVLRAQLDRVATQLGFTNEPADEPFYADELVHHDTAQQAVPRPCQSLWDYLVANRVAAESPTSR